MKWITTVSAYVYWPLLYFAIYMPFVVPRLDRWHHIPFWITWLAIIGFITILAACGTRKSHRLICIHAFSMARFQARATMAGKYCPDFGVAAYCGFGRVTPSEMPQVLHEHLQAIELR